MCFIKPTRYLSLSSSKIHVYSRSAFAETFFFLHREHSLIYLLLEYWVFYVSNGFALFQNSLHNSFGCKWREIEWYLWAKCGVVSGIRHLSHYLNTFLQVNDESRRLVTFLITHLFISHPAKQLMSSLTLWVGMIFVVTVHLNLGTLNDHLSDGHIWGTAYKQLKKHWQFQNHVNPFNLCLKS